MQKYDVYVGQVIELAQSMVIKSVPTADTMNVPLLERGEKIPNDLKEWRYYKHLAGEMCPSDRPVKIISLDTGVEVELNKELLKKHKKTANVYRYNPSYIESLQYDRVDMYHYIRGVFYPIDYRDSIPAKTGTVLYYTKSLIEPQEVNLLTEISRWVDVAHNRFMFEGYVNTNDAYVLAFNNILKGMLPGIILAIRTEHANTEEAHSYHVSTYLESHQGIDKYVPYLTHRQKMFLYRNIRYIERNAGKQDVFEWLVDVLLTGWDMPTVSYSVGQQIHSPEDGELYPDVTGVVNAINFKELQSGRDLQQIDLFSIIRKEYDLAKLNPEYEPIYYDDLKERLELTQYPSQKTKLIEVTAIDPENLNPFKIEYALFNEWVHVAASERYDQTHEILNPQSGDVLRMTTKEMLVLYLYAAFKGYTGVEIPFLNSFNAMGVARKRWSFVPELEAYLLPSWEGRYEKIYDFYAKTEIEHEVYNNIVSSDDFYSYVNTINKVKVNRYWFSCNVERDQDQAAARAIFRHHYPDYDCRLHLEYRDYDDFFKSFGVDYKLIAEESWKDIATEAFNTVTGFNDNSEVSQTDIQKAMVELISMLSSYTIHFARQMASETVLLSDCLGVIVGETPYSSKTSVNVLSPDGELSGLVHETRYKVKPYDVDISANAAILEHFRTVVDIDMDISCNAVVNVYQTVSDPTPEIDEVKDEN